MANDIIITNEGHEPVLCETAIDMLNVRPDGVYIDATFGRGGHSRAILARLNQNGRLFVIDRDVEAIAFAQRQLGSDPRVVIQHSAFDALRVLADTHHIDGDVDGILLDLGVSSPQLDEANRGFSFLRDGPLDMRMDTTSGMDAAAWINQASSEEIAKVLKEYGEERYAKRIAQAIVRAVREKPILTTGALSDIVSKAHPRWEKNKHPATRVFQAIRIFINDELNLLHRCLDQTIDVLKIGGRLVVISFHSLEDRVVKRFMRKHSQGRVLPVEVPMTYGELGVRLRVIGKSVKADALEIQRNPRARSAVLRVAEKIS